MSLNSKNLTMTVAPDTDGVPMDPGMSVLDILLPTISFILIVLLALLLLSVLTQNLWWKRIFCIRRNRVKVNREKPQLINVIQINGLKQQSQNHKITHPKDEEVKLFSTSDLEIISNFKCFQNNPKGLMRIALPVILSIAFCPITIYLYPEMMKFFWTSAGVTTRPNINDAIASFLVPAGIVYAVAFGFTFQDILIKQQDLEGELKRQVDAMIKMKNIVEFYKRMSLSCRRNLVRVLKEYTVTVMHITLNDKVKPCAAIGKLWTILDTLRNNEERLDNKLSETDKNIHTTLYEHTLLLDSYLSARFLSRKINILQWLFLECLGFVSFFGVLFLSAESYRLELTMCILTVATVSAFSYILADFDCAYHGAFRLDFSVYVTYLEELQRVYTSLAVDVETTVQGVDDRQEVKMW